MRSQQIFFGDVTQAFDFRHKGVDVFFRDDEIVVIPGFDVGALQQSEQPFFFRVSRGKTFDNSSV